MQCSACKLPAKFLSSHHGDSSTAPACSLACSRLICVLRIGAHHTSESLEDSLGALFASLRGAIDNLRRQPDAEVSVLNRYVQQQCYTLERLLAHKRLSPEPESRGDPAGSPLPAWYHASDYTRAPVENTSPYPPPRPQPDQPMLSYLAEHYANQATRPMHPQSWLQLAGEIHRLMTKDPSSRLKILGKGQEGTVLVLPADHQQLVIKIFKAKTDGFWRQVGFLLYNYHSRVVPRILLWATPESKSPYIVMEYLRDYLPLQPRPWTSLFRTLPTDEWTQLLVAIIAARQSLHRHDYYVYHDLLNAGNIAAQWSPVPKVKFYEVGRVEEQAHGGQDLAFLQRLVTFLLTDWSAAH
jgi:hypothetical protein